MVDALNAAFALQGLDDPPTEAEKDEFFREHQFHVGPVLSPSISFSAVLCSCGWFRSGFSVELAPDGIIFADVPLAACDSHLKETVRTARLHRADRV